MSRAPRPPAPVAGMGPLLAAVLAALLAGCSAGSDRPADPPAGDRPGSSAAAVPPTRAEPAATTPPRAYRTGPAPTGRPGPLAGTTPTGPGGWSAQLWFGGVLVGREGGRLVVAYPAIEASSDGRQLVAHAKVALFRCSRRKAPGSADFAGCTDRRVEYGDLAAPQLAVTRTGTGGLLLAGDFPTYAYGPAVDRGPGLPLRWTGRTFPLRVGYAPGPPRPGRYRGFTGTASVTIGEATSHGRARLDLGYPNRGVR